jgi:hypothetical protein
MFNLKLFFMKKNDFKKPFAGVLTLLLCITMSVATAQDMYISNGAILHYAGGDFASGHIDNNNSGTFSIGTNFPADNDNYVSGPVSLLAAGTYAISLEDVAAARNPSVTTTGAATVTYSATASPSGTAPSGYVLANKEIYTFTGNVSGCSATPLGTTTFGAADGAVIPVFATSESGPWSATATAGTTTKMSFAKEDSTLSTETYVITAENFTLYPNPVSANASGINFNLPSAIQQLSITMYDVTGKVMQQYHNVPVQAGANSINKPEVAQGLYVLQFSFNKGEQTVTKRIIIE